jgi:hypothetical protein
MPLHPPPSMYAVDLVLLAYIDNYVVVDAASQEAMIQGPD